MNDKIKLYVLTGFLGSGKTTFIKNILENIKDKKIGIIQNEFGKISIDGEILRDDDIKIVELNKGSLFCSCLKLNFVQALADMSEMGLDMLFVESSGLADPSNLFEILDAVKVLKPDDPYELSGTICIIDAFSYLNDIKELEAVVRQTVHCNIAVINKCDLVSKDRISDICSQIKEINSKCLILEAVDGVIDPKHLDLDLSAYEWAPNEETTNTVDTKPKTFSIEFEDVPKDKMDAFLKAISPLCYRIKGFGKIDGKWNQIDVASGLIDYKSTPDKSDAKGRLVFISRIGIKLIRDIKNNWDEIVKLPVELFN